MVIVLISFSIDIYLYSHFVLTRGMSNENKALRAHVPYLPTTCLCILRVFDVYVLTCLHAFLFYVPTGLSAYMPFYFTCLRTFVIYVPTCLRVFVF